jgi:hypothetical protein
MMITNLNIFNVAKTSIIYISWIINLEVKRKIPISKIDGLTVS